MIEGRHVKVLGHGCDPAKLGDVEQVKSAIAALVEACGMRVLGLHAYDVEIEVAKLRAVPFEDEGGITVVGVLSTSHAAIHTWPARGFFVLDVFSCRDFEPSKLATVLVNAFARQPWPGHADLEIRGLGVEARGMVEITTRGMQLRQTEVSHALEMPEEWRQPVPEYAPRS